MGRIGVSERERKKKINSTSILPGSLLRTWITLGVVWNTLRGRGGGGFRVEVGWRGRGAWGR